MSSLSRIYFLPVQKAPAIGMSIAVDLGIDPPGNQARALILLCFGSNMNWLLVGDYGRKPTDELGKKRVKI